jgi:hypothetical protein
VSAPPSVALAGVKSLFAAGVAASSTPGTDAAGDVGIQLSPPLHASTPPAPGAPSLDPHLPAAGAGAGTVSGHDVEPGATTLRRVVNPDAATFVTAGMLALTGAEPTPLFVWQEGTCPPNCQYGVNLLLIEHVNSHMPPPSLLVSCAGSTVSTPGGQGCAALGSRR